LTILDLAVSLGVMTKQALFNSSYGLKLSIPQVVSEVVGFMKLDTKRRYKITIGSDSEQVGREDVGSRDHKGQTLQNFSSKKVAGGNLTGKPRSSRGQADFVTAIVVHRVGNGGRYFWRRLEFGTFHTLRDRIIKEVMLSLEIAQEVLAELKRMKNISFDFEVHADVGENGETKAMIQEVVGMIRAYNFEPKTKPGSYAATNVADRHV